MRSNWKPRLGSPATQVGLPCSLAVGVGLRPRSASSAIVTDPSRYTRSGRWHLTSRWMRKICSHTIGVMLCQREGLSLLSFGELIED